MLTSTPPLLSLVLTLGATAPGSVADTSARATVTCDSAALHTPVGSALDTLFLTLGPANGSNTPLPSPWAETVSQAVAARVVLPRPVSLPVWFSARSRSGARRWTAPDTVRATVSNAVMVLVTDGGHLDGAPRLAASALDVRADSAVIRAVRLADSAGAFTGAPVEPHKKLALYIGLGTRDRDVNPTHRSKHADPYATAASTVTVPLALVRRDVLVLNQRPAPAPPTDSAFVALVDSVRRTMPAADGTVLLDYVVDATGAVVPGTVMATRFSSPVFGGIGVATMERERFAAPRVAGCTVPTFMRTYWVIRGRI